MCAAELSPYELNDHLYTTPSDERDRVILTSDYDQTQPGVGVGDTASVSALSHGRVTVLSAGLDTAAADDLTVALLIEGRSVATVTIATGETFGETEVQYWHHNIGDVLATEVTAADAGQTGTLTVGLDLEPSTYLRRAAEAPESAVERFTRSSSKESYLPPARQREALLQPGTTQEQSSQVYASSHNAELRARVARVRRQPHRPGVPT